MASFFLRRTSFAILLAGWVGSIHGGALIVPNGSFESPATIFVDTTIDSWQKGPKPDWFDESGGFLWSQLTGTFKNTPPTSSDHLDNCDGNQAIWMFADSQVELFQDYDSTGSNETSPSHAFDARFEVGKSYSLIVAVNGGGGGMQPTAALSMGLYYRDAASNKMMIETRTIANSPGAFSNHTHLIDFEVRVPAVPAEAPWAGQHIGIQILSMVDTNSQGGYWDLDNIRLSSIREPSLSGLVRTNGLLQFILDGDAGVFEILTSTDIGQPAPSWSSLGMLTNSTGTTNFTAPFFPVGQHFYKARQVQ